MLLAIDVGNTNITMGVFEKAELVATWRMATDINKMPDEYAILLRNMLPLKDIQMENITGVSICSVVPPLTQVFQELSNSYFKLDPLIVGTGIKRGVRIEYENPRDVGSDRVVDAAAAYDLHPLEFERRGVPSSRALLAVGRARVADRELDHVQRGLRQRGYYGHRSDGPAR